MFWFKRALSDEDRGLLGQIAAGATLKSHRNIEGEKHYQLYPVSGTSQPVPFEQVQRLLSRGYLTTNQKFPAATFLLTTTGQQQLESGAKKRGIASIVRFDTKKR